MKNVLLAAAILLGTNLAHAADPAMPPCLPSQVGGSGVGLKTGETPDGRWLAWNCIVNGQLQPFGVWGATDYQVVHPATTGLSFGQTAAAYWSANVRADGTDAMRRLRTTALAAVQP
jgi:hypothetical protein